MEEKNREIQKVRIEMQQNEDVFDLLEKKYNDQHQKVMVSNSAFLLNIITSLAILLMSTKYTPQKPSRTDFKTSGNSSVGKNLREI